jgi:hypothetical protein
LFALLAFTVLAFASQPFDLTVHSPPELSWAASRVRAIDAATLARSLAHAGLDLPPRVNVLLIANDHEAARGAPPWIVGSAVGSESIVIYPQRIGSYPYDSLESVVLHEVVHLALSTRAAGRPLPRWFHEGVAVSVEAGWGLGSQVRLLMAAARDPRLDDLSALFASEAMPATTTAYLLSAALVEDVRRRYGPTVPGRIAAHVARDVSFEDAFISETGVSVDQAARDAWRVYRGVRWLPIITSASGVWGGILALAALAFAVRLHRRRQRRRRWEAEERAEPTVTDDSESRADDPFPQ